MEDFGKKSDIKEDNVLLNGDNITKQIELELEQEEAKFKKSVAEKIGLPEDKFEIIVPKNMEYPNTPEEWMNAFEERNVYMNDRTYKMLESMQTSRLPENQKFIEITVEDLFRDILHHEYKDILTKAQGLGLQSCEQDDAPKLRLATEQNPDDWYTTAMKSIDTGGVFHVWSLIHRSNGLQYLDWHYGGAKDEYGFNMKLMFRLSPTLLESTKKIGK